MALPSRPFRVALYGVIKDDRTAGSSDQIVDHAPSVNILTSQSMKTRTRGESWRFCG